MYYRSPQQHRGSLSLLLTVRLEGQDGGVPGDEALWGWDVSAGHPTSLQEGFAEEVALERRPPACTQATSFSLRDRTGRPLVSPWSLPTSSLPLALPLQDFRTAAAVCSGSQDKVPGLGGSAEAPRHPEVLKWEMEASAGLVSLQPLPWAGATSPPCSSRGLVQSARVCPRSSAVVGIESPR